MALNSLWPAVHACNGDQGAAFAGVRYPGLEFAVKTSPRDLRGFQKLITGDQVENLII